MRIAYFAPVYFDDLKQRPQHIAEHLSKEHEVLYIEPTISLIRYLLKGGKSCKGAYYKVNPNLHILRLNGMFTCHKVVEAVDVLQLNSISERLQLRAVLKDCDLIWCGYSGWYRVLRVYLKRRKLIFDKMDEESELVRLWPQKCALRQSMKKMICRADFVIVTAEQFYESLRGKKPVCLIPNAVETSAFCGKEQKKTSVGSCRVYGYIGTIGEWFDDSVIREILRVDKTCRIVLIGKVLKKQLMHPRVEYLPPVPKEQLAKLISGFDVCLYNFKQNDLLDTIDPVKIYEYLAMNKPVLAVRCRETEKLQREMMLYRNLAEVRQLLQDELKVPFKTEAGLQSFLRENSWENRMEKIGKVIDRVAGR